MNSFHYTQYCYDGKYMVLDTLININGYYTMWEAFTSNVGFPSVAIKDTTHWNCIFFKDGIFLYYFFPEFFKTNSINSSKKKDRYINRIGFWGRYVLNNDTIKAQFIEPPGGMSWSMNEVWFKIIDSNTIQWLYMKHSGGITNEAVKQYQASKEKRQVSRAEFVPLNDIPDPHNTWLIKRKWFWCNEQQYKEWKKRIKYSQIK